MIHIKSYKMKQFLYLELSFLQGALRGGSAVVWWLTLLSYTRSLPTWTKALSTQQYFQVKAENVCLHDNGAQKHWKCHFLKIALEVELFEKQPGSISAYTANAATAYVQMMPDCYSCRTYQIALSNTEESNKVVWLHLVMWLVYHHKKEMVMWWVLSESGITLMCTRLGTLHCVCSVFECTNFVLLINVSFWSTDK